MSWILDKILKLSTPVPPVVSTRAIADVFQPDVARPCQVQYTIQQVATSGQDGTVKLLSDAANPPTIERDEVRNASTGGGTVAHKLSYIVPAGHYVKMVASGNTTNTITQQSETSLR